MDNATYDALNQSPNNDNEMYSTLATIPTKTNNNDGYQKNGDVNKQAYSKGAPNTNKILLAVIMIMMVILLLITIASLALSVAAYNQSKSEQAIVQNQQNEADNDRSAAQTQLNTTCNNLSQILFQVDTKINDLTSLILQNIDMELQPNCGPGLWYQVAHLNISDLSQQCPSVWREYNENGIRACGRPTTLTGSCATKHYLIRNQYSRVCGRVIGYFFKTPDAFGLYGVSHINFDGINITSGAQSHHIWSFVAGQSSHDRSDCSCSSDIAATYRPPVSIGDHYYCESGAQANTLLWDGQHCEGTCCNGPDTNASLPWFSVQLPAPATERVEVSICADESTDNEDIPIKLLEIYVQ